MIRVTENLTSVRLELENAAELASRNPDEITLIAVSKRHSVDAIREAVGANQRHFGENFVAEGVGKIEALADPSLVWHFIGAIQSNKTRAIATHFDWVHTVDRIKIARRLSEQRPEELPPLQVCLQVNIDNEPQKAGVNIDAALSLAQQVHELPRLQLRGLMCLPRPRVTLDEQRQPFARMHALAATIRQYVADVDQLSMGMSADTRAAILEGSTMVRVGTAIFGARPETQHQNLKE
ncbi:MAG: YggS family pyridoxal phosphate-dependent enzyme [Pseudomonadota bacterium]